MCKIWKKLCQWWGKNYYVTLDMRDSSVTFGKALYKVLEPEIMISANLEPKENEIDTRGKVMVFYEPESECYGFVVSPNIKQATQLADVQFNTKHKSVGFESLVPTVARMLHDYGIKGEKAKLKVSKQSAPGMVWWKIERN